MDHDTHPVLLGADFNSESLSYFAHGRMDEARIWNVARSPVEIRRDMAASLTGTETGLAGYWQFNDGTGTTTADLTANGNTATFGGYTKPTVPAWYPPATALGSGRSLAFDGDNDYVDMGNPGGGELDLGADATVEAWVRFAAAPSGSLYTIASKDEGPGSTNKWIFGYADNYAGVPNATILHINNPAGNAVFLQSNAWTPTPGVWYHLAVVKNGDDYTFYRDGVADGTATTAVAVPAAAASFEVGRAEGNLHWNGQIDDLRVWNTARSQAEIQNSKDAALAGTELGLAGYWTFDDGGISLTAADATTNANVGRLGGTLATTIPAWSIDAAAGSTGTLLFDGVDDYVQVGNPPELEMTNALSIEAWIHPAGIGDPTHGGILVNKEGEYEVARYPDGTIRWAFANTSPGWTFINTGVTAPLNAWTHIAVTYDAGVVRTYANGVLAHTYNGSGNIGDVHGAEDDFRIGHRQLGTQPFAGRIDEVRIWSTARSDSEIAANTNSVLDPAVLPELVGSWRFEEGSGLTTADQTANGNDGDLGGALASYPAWQTADGAPLLDVGATASVSTGIDRFAVTVTEDLLVSAAANPANYGLREAGNNGTFGDGDDSIFALTPSYGGLGSTTINLTIDPEPLQPGHYRFETLPGLTDRAGNSATGFTQEFFVTDPAAGRIENNTGNNSIPGATPLPMTEEPAGSGFFTALGVGTISGGSDRDYWRFDAEAGDRVTARLETDGGSGIYPFLYLQNASGTNQVTTSGDQYGSPIQIQDFTITSPGTYYLYVGASNTTGYRLRVDQGRGTQLESENNDSQGNADLLILSGAGGVAQAKVAGALPAGDTAGDFYRLNHLNAGNTIDVTLELPPFGSLATDQVRLSILEVGNATPLASSTTGTASQTVSADGIYYVRVEGLDDLGLRAQYLLNISVTDSISPFVTATSLPDQVTTSTAVIDRFSLTFSEDMDAGAINQLANLDLRSDGGDGIWGNSNDQVYTLSSNGYTTGLTASFLIADGPLQPGDYRFTASASLTDRAGNPLDPVFVRDFTVAPLAPYTIEDRANDVPFLGTPLGTPQGTPDGSITRFSSRQRRHQPAPHRVG